ncbi:CK5P3 protein, partial [Serilophus lunatus]|nr:CK5P3 protein [Serilophus lunatus]
DNVRQELLALVKDLPSLLSQVGAGVSALGEAIELYQACVEFVCDSPAEVVVPLLRHVGSRGNTTVFEWRTGLEPLRVERPQLEEVPEPPKEDTVSPGKGLGGFQGGLGSFSPQIDWGDFMLEPTQGDGAAANTGAQAMGGVPSWLPSPSSSPPAPEGVACGSDALTLLENSETRNQFIDELMELELFLAQRLVEMEEEADIVAMSQLQLAPAVLQGQTSAHVGSQLATARALLAQLCSRSVQHLFMILASPR